MITEIKELVDLSDTQVLVLIDGLSGKVVLPNMEYSLTDLKKIVKAISKVLKNLQAEKRLNEVDV